MSKVSATFRRFATSSNSERRSTYAHARRTGVTSGDLRWLRHAYSQLPLDKKSKEYVTINVKYLSHTGLTLYNRLPYGISSASVIFQRTMKNILQGIPHVAMHLDDVILTGATKAQHLETVDMVLGRLEEAGLQRKRKKCTFLVDEVVYLGHRIDQHGLHPVQIGLHLIFIRWTPF